MDAKNIAILKTAKARMVTSVAVDAPEAIAVRAAQHMELRLLHERLRNDSTAAFKRNTGKVQ